VKVSEYADLDAVALAALVRQGEVTPAELAATAREAVESVNGQLNALAFPLYGEPLDCAPDGPFAGVPFLIKDTGVAGGVAVSVGSRFLEGRVVPGDADIMARFRAAGLAAIGCTAVPELAISFATESVRGGITRNPRDLARGTGGSSGGAAALVAARAVPMAHGNDGAGSIRVPAAACGLVGLKPTRGRTPATPAESEGLYGLTYEFALTRSLRDCAALLDAVHGPGLGAKYEIAGPARPYARELGQGPGRLRVGVMLCWLARAGPLERRCLPSSLPRRSFVAPHRSSGKQRRGPPRARARAGPPGRRARPWPFPPQPARPPKLTA